MDPETIPQPETTIPRLVFDATNQQPIPNSAWLNSFGPLPSAWQNAFWEEDRDAVSLMVSQSGSTHAARIGSSQKSWGVALQCEVCDNRTLLWAIQIPARTDDLSETLARERALGEMRMRFLSLVSHEFRTPLTVILSSAELLEHYGWNWPEAKRKSHFLRMQGAVANMTSLLDNVAFLGRAESGRLENAPDSLSVLQLVESVVEELAPLRGLGQEIEIQIQPESASVNLDGRIVRAVLSNFLSNALRFSPSLGTISILVQISENALELLVDDQGGGIPHLDASRVWEPFERGSNSMGISGSGLGLAIVARCMELVGGSATHQPNPHGKGTRSRAIFPLGETA